MADGPADQHRREKAAQKHTWKDYLYGLFNFPQRMRNIANDIDYLIMRQENLHRVTKIEHDYVRAQVDRIWREVRDTTALRHNLKQSGYDLARDIAARGKNAPVPPAPDPNLALGCKPATQADIESDWFYYWMDQLKLAPLAHRKLWEMAYILQSLFAHGKLAPGAKAIGFGCGEEPLPSLFAARGMDVTVTDLHPEKVAELGWIETGEYTHSLMATFIPDLLDEDTFRDRVSLQYVDMNDIPPSLDEAYDVCWSVCALEHLGSIEKGLNFIENSLRCLKPGGVAVHTTEFNYSNQERTLDNWLTVLFRQPDFQRIADRLTEQGHTVAPLSFDVGDQPMDRFIDVPPYTDVSTHLKMSIDGFPSTCFGITVQKAARP